MTEATEGTEPMIAAPIYTALDTARTRRSDPEASHIAGDRSQKGLPKVKAGILRVLELRGPMTGVLLNHSFANSYWVDRLSLPKCAWDTPRKRLSSLCEEDGYVDVVDHLSGSLEAVYALSPEGRRYLERVSS